MNAEEMQFRTAAFGGFQRADVLGYIQRMTRQHQDEMQAVNAELKEAREQLQTLQMQMEEAKEAQQTGTERTLASENAALQAERDALSEENTSLRAQMERLQAQLDAWAPDVNSYDILRDQVGAIELDARARSAALLRQAERQQQAIYDRAEATLRHTEQEFHRARESAEATLQRLTTELTRIQAELAALTDVMEEDEQAMSILHVGQPAHREGGTADHE